MSENANLQRLNEISTVVSKRDLEIWENLVYSVCIRKQTAKLDNEIIQMQRILSDKKRENKMLEEQLEAIEKSNDIEYATLKMSESSFVLQNAYKETLVEEMHNLKKKYTSGLDMYTDELQAYRNIYENASQEYNDLKSQKIEIKKLEVKKMILQVRIDNLNRSHQQYKEIQEQRFIKTVVRFAEFYTLYHKNEKLKLMVQAKKKEEQSLIQEHFRLTEEVKVLKKIRQNSLPLQSSIPKIENLPLQTASTEVEVNRLQKFLDEDFPPCSLTALSVSQQPLLIKENTKVKILDMKTIKPPLLKVPKTVEPNLELRKKMEAIMKTAKMDAKRQNSFQVHSFDNQKLGNPKNQTNTEKDKVAKKQKVLVGEKVKVQNKSILKDKNSLQTSKTVQGKVAPKTVSKNIEKKKPIVPKCGTTTPKMAVQKKPMLPKPVAPKILSKNKVPPQKKSAPKLNQSEKIQKKNKNEGMKTIQNKNTTTRKCTPQISQVNKLEAIPKINPNDKTLAPKTPSLSQNEKPSSQSNKPDSKTLSQGDKPMFLVPKPLPKKTNSILKKGAETFSKVFVPQKKSVTFEKDPTKVEKFPLFEVTDKKSTSGIVKNIDVFKNTFLFNKEEANVNKEKIVVPSQKEGEANNMSFTMETASSTFGTYGGDSGDKKSDMTFDLLENSFNRTFGEQLPLNQETVAVPSNEAPAFSFLSSQGKADNPFSFF